MLTKKKFKPFSSRTVRETIRTDGVRVYEEDVKPFNDLKKKWKMGNNADVYRKAIEECNRSADLHLEIDNLRNELKDMKDSFEEVNYTLNVLYSKIDLIIESKKD